MSAIALYPELHKLAERFVRALESIATDLRRIADYKTPVSYTLPSIKEPAKPPAEPSTGDPPEYQRPTIVCNS